MARLSQSQLSGFRIGTSPPTEPEPPNDRARPAAATPSVAQSARTRPDRAVPATAAGPDPPRAQRLLGPIPAAPTRTELRHKVGLTLPLEVAERVRALTAQGYALADLVMVAYQNHRDRLVEEHNEAGPRRLVFKPQGRSPVTVALSKAERAALDTLAQHLGSTRSHTVAALLQHQLESMP